MSSPKQKLLIIDNSIAHTGAFRCALNEAVLMNAYLETSFLIPQESTLGDTLAVSGISYSRLSFVEIGKAVKKLVGYGPALIKNGLMLRKIVKKEQIDVVQVNDFYNLLGAFLKITGSPVKLITYVRFLPQSLPGPLRKLWTALAIKYSYKVICVSDAVKAQMPDAPNVVRLYDPVFFSDKYPVEKATTSNKIIFTYIANFIQGKGQNFALTSFEAAIKMNPNISLQFAGGDMGLEKNKLFKQALERRVADQGLQQQITFLPFIDDTEKLIKESDVLLNFSESESFSMTCVEASYYGRPVIATKCGGPEEIINHGVSGLLVENRNVEEMTKAILTMAELPANEREAMGQQGRIYTKEKFDINAFVDNFKLAVL